MPASCPPSLLWTVPAEAPFPMIPALLPEAETEILLAKVRPQIAALAIAVDLDRVGGRLRRRSLV